jgi:DNA-binding response OmpR family regulator
VASLNILLVDDDVDFADLTADQLHHEGHRVSVARDAASARSLASAEPPDIVLLDLGLPDGDGFEVARGLRATLPAMTPIVILTGRREAAFPEHVDLILSKPVASEFFGGLLEYIRRRREHLIAPQLPR